MKKSRDLEVLQMWVKILAQPLDWTNHLLVLSIFIHEMGLGSLLALGNTGAAGTWLACSKQHLLLLCEDPCSLLASKDPGQCWMFDSPFHLPASLLQLSLTFKTQPAL